jgi:hypothetical protein
MRTKRTTETWPPAELGLPNLETLERLSRPNVQEQQVELCVDRPDDSREARFARILGTVPGVMTADQMSQ